MDVEKISIITVSFNHARFIENNIQSVLNQDYPNYEHIIIDAGSTDGTIDILRKYDHLIWTSEPDRGQSHGLNKGFKKATGDIIGWFNSDDIVPPNALNKVFIYFNNNPDQIAVVGNQAFLNIDGEVQFIQKSKPYTYDYLLNEAKGITQNSLFFKREIFNDIGYLDESLNYVMDRDLFIRMAKLKPVPYINETLGAYRVHDDTKLSSGSYKFALELLSVRKKFRGRIFSKSHKNNLYLIFTQPLRRIKFIRKQVQKLNRCRK